MKYLLLTLLITSQLAYSMGDLPANQWQGSITYTRQPRYSEPVYKDGEIYMGDASQLQDFYDGGQPNVYTESDMVQDYLDGRKKVLFDCTKSRDICAATDMRISPNSVYGAFTVARGGRLYSPPISGFTEKDNPLDKIEFKATSHELWLHNFATGKSQYLGEGRMPEWCGNDCLLFASTRAGTFPPWAYAGPDLPDVGTHIFRASFDSNTKRLGPAVDLTPAAATCMSPAVNPSGTITVSCWEGDGDRAYPSTPVNHFWIFEMVGNGTGNRSIINAHSPEGFHTAKYLAGICDPKQCGEGITNIKLPRGYVALPDGRYAFVTYYRANHQGMLGAIVICEPSAVEGYSQSRNIPDMYPARSEAGSGRFSPRCFISTPYANDQDGPVKIHIGDKKAMGKGGYPAAVPPSVGLYMFTHCRGVCYSPSTPFWTFPENFGGEPASKREIRVALVDRITDPFDKSQSKVIACADEQYNCWDARYVEPYSAIYGQAAPARAPDMLTGKTTKLQVVNARLGELDRQTWHTNYKPYWDCTKLGCADDDWMVTIAAIRITEVLPWPVKPTRKGDYATGRVWDFPLESDGSVAMEIPCQIGYRLSGVNKAGEKVARDQMVHAAVCGETVTCYGCHEAHSEERAALYKQSAVERFKGTQAAK